MNCYAFYSFGKIFEMLSNRAHLAMVFLLSALGGGILSLVLQPGTIAVGASGGIVGLVSYLAVYSFKRRKFISNEFRKSLLTNIGFILIFGLVLYQVVDNWGHIGGLITGAVYGLVQIPSDEYTDPREANGVTETLGLGALGIYLAACAFSILLIFRIV
jgi:rhomboid protease GluP